MNWLQRFKGNDFVRQMMYKNVYIKKILKQKLIICKFTIIFFLPLYPKTHVFGWGFFAHKHINRCAVFTLPSSMFNFYKHNIGVITENAVNPDKRRYVIEGEAANHYIDIEHYEQDGSCTLPKEWGEIVEIYGKDLLISHGIVPWHIISMIYALTSAFKQGGPMQILKLSADIGHYIADANVPLHATFNYDGQFSNQHGIHAFWESRLPEMFINEYDFFIGQAEYIKDTKERIWNSIKMAHEKVSILLEREKVLSLEFPLLQKYSFEQRGGLLQKVYSAEYSHAYHSMLDGQIENQMKNSIKMIGDIWYTCWVNAGEPDLDMLLNMPQCNCALEEDFSKKLIDNIAHECGD